MKVLMIDDDQITSEQVALYLSQKGMCVKTRNTAVRAKEVILGWRPDIIILDEIMPEKTGTQLYRELQSDLRTRDIPVIFVTAATNKQEMLSAVNFGMSDHLSKPFRMKDLAEAILVNESIAGLNKVWNSGDKCLNSLLHKYGKST